MYIYMYMYVCIYICMYVCMYVYVCIYVCICIYVCMYVCICMYICMYMYVYMYVSMTAAFIFYLFPPHPSTSSCVFLWWPHVEQRREERGERREKQRGRVEEDTRKREKRIKRNNRRKGKKKWSRLLFKQTKQNKYTKKIMGSAVTCVSSGNRQQDTSPKTSQNDNEEEDMWHQRFLMEVGKDSTSVTRDFPRIPVYVRTATRNNYYEPQRGEGEQQQQPVEKEKKQKTHVEMTGHMEDAADNCLALRSDRVRTSIELLMELCGEDATGMLSVWQTEEQRLGIADASSLLLSVLLKSGMLLQVKKETEWSESCENDASGISPTVPNREMCTDETTTATVPNGKTEYGKADAVMMSALSQYIVQSKALRLMQYMVQSAVFFSIQWLTGVFRFPWCRHMHDIVWTVHVYSEKDRNQDGMEDEDVELIIVQHKLTLRHYVEPKELPKKPRFEVDWTCTICIDPRHLLHDASNPPTMGKDAEVRQITAEVLAARVEMPPKMACCVSRVWRKRRDALKDRLWNRFQVELDLVPALHGRTTN
ncbi:hypothetical protein MOQ_000963 [Trypanosoma cruzi marinkellei]|uniref:Uncharacterized protein n=1 Tax=Trypanosoma cruzi marinkellei TaxID=85056 RepID=K2MU73_TRYCR|nr:hypothetical protein MOQ_000963 [Trypanosoma cruzi marinkellei]